MEIQHIIRQSKGSFNAMDSDTEAGSMTYSRAGSDKMIIDHTEVDPAYKGQRVGNQLVMAAVDYARENGIRIIPLCPFAKSVFDKTPEIRDVL
jgi:uncharacterized protein